MTVSKIAFTINRLRKIEPTPGKRSFYYDTNTPGLRLQVTKAGTKTFQFYKHVPNFGAWTFTIGRFPDVTLRVAQEQAAELNGKVSGDRGITYIESLKEVKSEDTFNDLFNAWYENRIAAGKQDMANVLGRYNNHIKKRWGKKKPSSITEKGLEKWFHKLIKRKKADRPGTLSEATANHCLGIIRAVYGRMLKGQPNPAAGIDQFKKESRERFLSGSELGRLFETLDKPATQPDLKDIVLLALFTGARKSNILGMRWADIDLEQYLWLIPSTDSKNGMPMLIPLIPETVKILIARKKRTSSIFVFPASKSKTGHRVDIHRIWHKLLKQANIEGIYFHDLRRSLGSWQVFNGSSIPIIGKSLGHSSSKSTEIYARLKDMTAVRDSMSGGVQAMIEASKKKIVNIGDE